MINSLLFQIQFAKHGIEIDFSAMQYFRQAPKQIRNEIEIVIGCCLDTMPDRNEKEMVDRLELESVSLHLSYIQRDGWKRNSFILAPENLEPTEVSLEISRTGIIEKNK